MEFLCKECGCQVSKSEETCSNCGIPSPAAKKFIKGKPLKPCKECSHPVSRQAVNCPNCGISNPISGFLFTAKPLGECKECSHQVSTRADNCPNCGAKDPVQSSGVIGYAAIGLVAFIIFNVFLSDESEKATEAKSNGADQAEIVKVFQNRHGLTADGLVGPKTCALLPKDNAKDSSYDLVKSLCDSMDERPKKGASDKRLVAAGDIDSSLFTELKGHEDAVADWVNRVTPSDCTTSKYSIGVTSSGELYADCERKDNSLPRRYSAPLKEVLAGSRVSIQPISISDATTACQQRGTDYFRSKSWTTPDWGLGYYSVQKNAGGRTSDLV